MQEKTWKVTSSLLIDKSEAEENPRFDLFPNEDFNDHNCCQNDEFTLKVIRILNFFNSKKHFKTTRARSKRVRTNKKT